VPPWTAAAESWPQFGQAVRPFFTFTPQAGQKSPLRPAQAKIRSDQTANIKVIFRQCRI
jgi:hypothetical protein